MKKPRRHFGTDQKATILKRYLVDKVPISDLCDEYGAAIVASRLQTTPCEKRPSDRQLIATGMGRSKFGTN